MPATTTDHGERLARIEGAYEHLATKADVERVRSEVERVRSELQNMKWLIGLGVPLLTVFASQLLDRFL